MADSAPKELSDFFAKKKKTKVKSSNLNLAPTDTKVDQSAQKMSKEEEGWEDEQIQTTQIKMDIAGKLTREEDKREEEVQHAAWGGSKGPKAKSSDPAPLSAAQMDKKFPTLGKAHKSSNINLDSGDGNITIKTTKNMFSTLQGQDASSDEEGDKRPKQIKPAMVTKTKGEKEAVALQREKDKYVDKKAGGTKKSTAKDDTAKEDTSDSDDDAENEAKPAPKEKVSKENVPPSEPKGKKAAEPQEASQDIAEDLKIAPDPAGARAKYEGRRKLERKPLPPSELKEKPKETKQSGKKKRVVCVEEDDKPKLAYIQA